MLATTPQFNDDERSRKMVVVIPRPKDVLEIDKRICLVEYTENSMVITFDNCLDLAFFCREYLFKVTEESTCSEWASPMRCLRVFYCDQLIDFDRHCFGSSLRIELPMSILHPGNIMYFYTLVRGLTYGSEFKC